jgi:hypothetical protein
VMQTGNIAALLLEGGKSGFGKATQQLVVAPARRWHPQPQQQTACVATCHLPPQLLASLQLSLLHPVVPAVKGTVLMDDCGLC